MKASNTKSASEGAVRTPSRHLPDRIEADITLQAGNRLNESGST